jgi:dihydrofolate reductase
VRRVIISEFLSLDGVMEDPSWTAKYWNDEIAKFKFDELFSVDALLLGRVTYQGFASAWPGRTDPQGYADRMNHMPKYVLTRTLQQVDWTNSNIVKGNLKGEINALKQLPGQDLLVFGSRTLAQDLIKHELVDRYHLLVYPVVLGKGKRLFDDGVKTNMTLVETRSFSSGVVLLTYQNA